MPAIVIFLAVHVLIALVVAWHFIFYALAVVLLLAMLGSYIRAMKGSYVPWYLGLMFLGGMAAFYYDVLGYATLGITCVALIVLAVGMTHEERRKKAVRAKKAKRPVRSPIPQ